MIKKLSWLYFLAILILAVGFFSFSSKTFAARSLSISSNKSSLFGDEELIITASSSGFTDGETIYIKGAFFQDGSTNYFGYSKKDDGAWVKNGDTTTNQRSIKIGSWDNTLTTKSDFSDGGYKGEGEYKLKVGFYYITSGGNLSSVNWSSNNFSVTLNEPDPTPTLTPTNTPVPTNIPGPTSSPTPTSKPNLTPTSIVKPSVKPTTDNSSKNSTSPASVLGENTANNSEKISPTSTEKEKTENKQNNLGMILVSAGGFLMLLCGIIWVYQKKKGKNKVHEEADNYL